MLRRERLTSSAWSGRCHRRRRWLSVLGVATALLASCRETDSPRAPLPQGSPVVLVTLDEYRFGISRSVPAGRVIFRFRNTGREIHRPALFALPDDLPPLDEQLRGSQRRAITPFAGMSNRAPGATGTFAVDLAEGRRYGFVCFARGPDNRSPHSLKGMSSEFRIGPEGE
ncbi:MAG: hypothetical protein M3P85_07555 [Actinomycetota bacterium]|nr:hypothetical protein [Actinomycetota bacterium]